MIDVARLDRRCDTCSHVTSRHCAAVHTQRTTANFHPPTASLPSIPASPLATLCHHSPPIVTAAPSKMSVAFDQLRGAVQAYGKRPARSVPSASPPLPPPIAAAPPPPPAPFTSTRSLSLTLSPPDADPLTRSRSRSPPPGRAASPTPSPSPMVDDDFDDDPNDYVLAQSSLTTSRGTKRKLHPTATATATATPAGPAPSPAAPAGKKPTAASRKLGQATAPQQRTEVEDVFDIDGMDNDQHLSSPSLLFPTRPRSSPARRPQMVKSRGPGTLGVRRQSVGEPKPSPGRRKPSPARASTASSGSLLSGAVRRASTMQSASGAAPPPRPLPSTSRLQRTVSSPAKLSTTEKRQQEEGEEKESTDADLLSSGVDLFKDLSFTQPPIRARPSVLPPYRPPASTAKRTLSAFATQPLKTARKPLQATRSSPLPSPSSFTFDLPSSSAPSTTSSTLHFSAALTGADRLLMEELQYLLDGCSQSSPLDVRHSSAIKLLHSFHRTHLNRQRRGEGHQQFFLMRAHGGFEQLCSAFQHCVDDEVLRDAFVGCAYLMSKEKANAQCASAEAVESLLDVLHGARRHRKEQEETKQREGEAEEDDEAVDDAPYATKIRSIRRRATQPLPSTSPRDDIRALFKDEPVFAKTSLPYSPSLLALSSLLSFSADAHFKGTFARVAGAFSTLTSLAHTAFCGLVTATQAAHPPASVASSTSSSLHLFHLQALLSILENLTHTHGDNQRLLLEAKVQPIGPGGTAAGGRALPFDVQSFPQLYFAMLQWCTHRVVHRLDGVDEEKAEEEADTVGSSDELNRSHLLLTTPTYTSLALLLCRLLVNLTNKSDRGVQILYYPYADPIASLASPSAAPSQRKTGVQIIADLVALCWYHPHLRSPQPSSTSSSRASTLNAECDLFDLLTLSIGVVINTAEQSAVIREVLLENCHVTVHRQADGALLSIRPDEAAVLSPFSLHSAEAVRVSWLDCLIDVFAHTYLALLALEQEEAEQQPPPPASRAAPPPPPAAVAPPQRYGSRAHSAPVVTPVEPQAVRDLPSLSLSSSSVEHASLVHRMLCSYTAMVIAVLAVHDALAFAKVQAALRGRAENAHVSHRPSIAESTGRRDDCLYDASPSPSASPPPEGREGEGRGGRAAVQVIFSLRLVVRLLNDFVLLQHESVMSEESVQSMLRLIGQLERTIKADSAFGV